MGATPSSEAEGRALVFSHGPFRGVTLVERGLRGDPVKRTRKFYRENAFKREIVPALMVEHRDKSKGGLVITAISQRFWIGS